MLITPTTNTAMFNEYSFKEKENSSLKGSTNAVDKEELSQEEQKQLKKLKEVDRRVKAHEQAHRDAGGELIRGGITYQYQRGPDGKLYVVGGEVDIDLSPVPNDPQGTIKKMQKVRRAALAPADPSPQDRSVAAKASQIESRARGELLSEKYTSKEKTGTIQDYII